MATNFSPCKGSYVLNQFPSNVMFGMNGFHVSASGAIQGHHGPLVNQSALNLAKIYMTINSWISLIIGLIELEGLELFALELEKLLHLTLFTL